VNEKSLLLIVSPDCYFCDEAREVLARLGLTAREIDLADDEAGELAGRGVPVVFFPVLWDGERVITYGRFSERELRRELAA
jgi:glutaredoxin